MNLQETMSNPELSNLDLSKVAALQQKRTLAFVNHFVITTVQFLNNFMKQSEHKLMLFERKLEKVEAALVLLETRLSSISEINATTTENAPEQNAAIPKTELDSGQSAPVEGQPQPTEPSGDNQPTIEPSASSDTQSSAEVTLSPEYDRFVKMVQVGVPLQAVKLKVSLEGLDPDVFENIVKK